MTAEEKVPDIMAALEASVATAKAERLAREATRRVAITDPQQLTGFPHPDEADQALPENTASPEVPG